ncbi:MAG: NADH-quinone oxidoreductase subunit N [Dehalococcoidia bacterium]
MVDFSLLLPEILAAGLALLVLSVDLAIPARWEARRNVITGWTAFGGLALLLIFTLAWLTGREGDLYNGLIFVDRYALLFKVLFIGTGAAVVLMSIEYVGKKVRHQGEFYALIVMAVTGAMLMAGAGELLTAVLAIELLSFSLYILVALSRRDPRSAEASTKYILLGAISTGFIFYGVSLIYGMTGSTFFQAIPFFLEDFSPALAAGFVFIIAGLGFKLSMFPFHLWAPDVYEGAPTPVTALVAVLSKAAAFAVALRFLAEAGHASLPQWQLMLGILAALTMAVGTLTALSQTNIKRLLAYSSVAQVGFVLMGVVALTPAATNAVLLHLFGYAFTNLAAFMVVIVVETKTGKENISDYAGLASREPFLAMVMSAALFSLAGLPIFAGFITKFYLFVGAAEADLLWLVIVGVVASFISLYYYLRVMREMYVNEPATPGRMGLSPLTGAILWGLFLGTVFIGVYPGPLTDAIDAATVVLTPFTGG